MLPMIQLHLHPLLLRLPKAQRQELHPVPPFRFLTMLHPRPVRKHRLRLVLAVAKLTVSRKDYLKLRFRKDTPIKKQMARSLLPKATVVLAAWWNMALLKASG